MISKNEFIEKLKQRNGFIVPVSYYKYGNYRRRFHSLKRIISKFEFPCKFEKGKCNSRSIMVANDPMCCCGGCRESVGYLQMVFEKDIWYYARRFNKKTGYWRKGKGCCLSREYRSKTCNTYYCDTFDSRTGETPFGEELWAMDRAMVTIINTIKRELEM